MFSRVLKCCVNELLCYAHNECPTNAKQRLNCVGRINGNVNSTEQRFQSVHDTGCSRLLDHAQCASCFLLAGKVKCFRIAILLSGQLHVIAKIS